MLTPQEPEQVDERTTVVLQEVLQEDLQDKKMESASEKMKRSEPAAAAIPFEVEQDILAEKLEDTSTGLTVSYMNAANLPQPVGGFERYQIYLEDSLRYPESALNSQVEGSVIVSFTVDADSIPHQLSVIKSLGYGCDEEALRLIREGPRWIPAISAGKILESEMKIPVNFKLPEGGR
jgi:protein TonB